MTAGQMKVAGAIAAALLLWWLFKPSSAPPARRKTELVIDADVNSLTFGDPITEPVLVDDGTDANHQRLLDLVTESNQKIAAYDAAHPEALQ